MITDAPLFVVDDDPTGAQGQEGVPMLLAWSRRLLEDALRDRPRALHLLTNSRAMGADEALAVVRDAAAAVGDVAAAPRIVLRGDSTLRGHVLPEYRGLCEGLSVAGAGPPLLLVPALPAAGRITRGGHHWLVRDGVRTPIAETEFATDRRFGYRASRLTRWADERSGGLFAAERGIEIHLEDVRAIGGADRIADALVGAAQLPQPAVVVPDAETDGDLGVIAEALRTAWQREPTIVVRCSPAFAGVLSGAHAHAPVPLPRVAQGLLVVVGSHVAMSSQQLAALDAAHPGLVVEVDPAALAGDGAKTAVQEAVRHARGLLARHRVAIVATARNVADENTAAEVGMRVALSVAAIVEGLRDACDVIVSKGGVTSAVNVRVGLHADRADVVGPVAPGLSLWNVFENGGPPRSVIVFPGNVGDRRSLARLVDRLTAA